MNNDIYGIVMTFEKPPMMEGSYVNKHLPHTCDLGESIMRELLEEMYPNGRVVIARKEYFLAGSFDVYEEDFINSIEV